MSNTISPIFIYHNQFCKDLVVLLYHENTVNVGYNYQVEVDNTMYHVVHDNHWLILTLHNIANYVLVSFH